MKYTLRHGEAIEFMRTLADKSIDAIITDLPYGTTACSWDVIIPFAPMWEQVKRICKGVFVTTASQPFTTVLNYSNLENLRDEVIWEKERPSNIFNVHSMHGKTHENISVFAYGKYTYNPQKFKNGRNRTREKMQRYVGNQLKHHDGKSITSYRSDWDGSVSMPRSVVYFVRDVSEDNHPTQKPLKLYEYLIRTYTNEGDTVLDFCFGSGTTGVACMRTNRKFVGSESMPIKPSDPDYFAIAKKRIEQAALQEPLFT